MNGLFVVVLVGWILAEDGIILQLYDKLIDIWTFS
jgi:hypothetical protein